jgi:hypothetical protein
MDKRIPCPARLRRVPPQFSWIDHRLVRNEHITGPGPEALSLYLLLVTVGDADGVSWYSTGLLGRLLQLQPLRVERARRVLEQHELIAFDPPFYQVLSLDPSLNAELSRFLAAGAAGGAR